MYAITELDRAISVLPYHAHNARFYAVSTHTSGYPKLACELLARVLWLNRRVCATVLYYELARRGLQDLFITCARWLTSFDI